MSAPDASSRDPLLVVGTIVERKYRIDRVVAEGGFGIVYAGHHLDLGVPVALKVLRPSLRADPEMFVDLLNQFREEASVLSRLRRASVVMVLDSGVSALGDYPHPLPWMALEWLEGETLKDNLEARRGQGGRSRAECMELLRPVLEAIAEAHELKIVHRDLKPSNIMLVPTKTGVSPRVLDFGIAKMMAPDVEETSSGETATDSNVRAFTAASAAPEQLSGSRTGPWTDVYALGLLLTEVLTDTPPIPADPNERYRVAFAKERPTPAHFGVDVGPWEPILARALAVRPSDRQKDARALLDELDGAGTTAVAKTALTTARPRPRLRRLTFALAAAALVAAGLGVTRPWRARGDAVLVDFASRPLVIVAEFEGGGAERTKRVASAFAELLSEQLRIGDTMRIPAADARAAMLEASGQSVDAPGVSHDVLSRLRGATGADVVVGGRIADEGDTLRAEIELYDAAKGALLGKISVKGPADDVNVFVRDAGARVRRSLGRPALTTEDETALRSTLPESAEASMAYVEGLAASRTFRFHDAVTRFEETSRLAPRFAPALAALALAHLRIGEQDKAREAAERATALASALPRREELSVYALAAETRHDWTGAVDNYRALAQFYPDRVDYVTSLARALVSAGKAPEAEALLDTARKRPQSDWDLMRIDLVEAFAYSRQSKDDKAMEVDKDAERLATKVAARVPLAEAVMGQAHIHHRGGRLDEAEALFDRARKVFVDVQDADNVLHIDAALAEIAAARGDFDRAIALDEKVIAAHRATGNLYRLARQTVSLCLIHAGAGHLTKARELCDEGGRTFMAAHDREGEGYRLINLADLDMMLGHLDGVADKIKEGRAIQLEIKHGSGVANAELEAARLAWLEGRMADAEAAFETAYAGATATREAGLVADAALERARFAFDRAGPAEPARFEDARKAVDAGPDARLTALFEAFAARRALGRSDATEARRLALAAEEHARKAHAIDAIVLALGLVLETAGPDEARRAELLAKLDELEAVEPKIRALISLSHASHGDEAIAFAQRAVDTAKAHRFVALEAVARRELARARGGSLLAKQR